MIYIGVDCRSRQIFGGAKDFCPNFPKLPRKNFGLLFVQLFSHADLFGDHPQTRSSCNSANVERHCLKSNHVGHNFACIFKEFAQIFCDFARIFTKSNLLGVRLHPCTPASYITHEIQNLYLTACNH